MIDWVRRRLSGGAVSILAGHYLLIYNHAREELVPLMRSEGLIGKEEEPFLDLTRDFPEATFRKGLDLLLSIGNNRSRILLLVDDETLRFTQRLPKASRLSDLRRNYYFHNSFLPPYAFRQELDVRQLKLEDVFEPNFARRAASVLPTNTFLFSEHILRVKFRKVLRKKLSLFSGFRLRDDPLTTSIVLEKNGRLDSACVVDESGEQTCSGPALALMEILRARAYEHFVWFLPSGCKESVTRAVVLAVRELNWFKSALLIYETTPPGEIYVQLRDGLFVGEDCQ
jgi:hypothetical protein